jgi:hypothetical protein
MVGHKCLLSKRKYSMYICVKGKSPIPIREGFPKYGCKYIKELTSKDLE